MVFKKIIFQNRYVALKIGLDPPPFIANAILNFHFDFLNPSLKYKSGALVTQIQLTKTISNFNFLWCLGQYFDWYDEQSSKNVVGKN